MNCARLVPVLFAAAVLSATPAPASASTSPQACPGVPGVVAGGSLPRAAARVAAGKPLRILAIGSSTTAGVGAGGAGGYPEVMAASLRGRVRGGIELSNSGASGERAPSTSQRLAGHVARGGYDLVVWQVGTNDARSNEDVAGFRAVLDSGIAAARRGGADVVLVDQQYYPGAGDIAAYPAFVAAIRSAGAKWGAPVVSRYAWMKRAAYRPGAPNLLAFDRFHNNDLGHACLGRGVAAAIAARL